VPASWFLGDFMAAAQLCRRRMASLRLCMVSPPMMNLLRVSGLAGEFPIHETEAEAREAFAAEEPQP
jgi:anti-anti-sigma regulatory factor